MRLFYILVVTYQVIAQYDEQLAKNFWYYTGVGYCRKSLIESWNCGDACDFSPPLTDVKVFKNTTGRNAGYIGYDQSNDLIIVYFRGTRPELLVNWMEDIDFVKIDYDICNFQCQVHRGFYYAYQNVRDLMYPIFIDIRAKHPNSKIAIIGHSLGAALATHARAHFWTLNIPVDIFYTFGSPRVGDEAFVNWFNDIVHPQFKVRITFRHDPFPHLPDYSWGFKHIGQEIYYPKQSKYTYCNDQFDEDQKCSDGNLVNLNVQDHLVYMNYNIAVFALLQCQ